MRKLILKAYCISKELDLNKIAVLTGNKKKYTWEEPLIMEKALLSEIIEADMQEDARVLLFSFGSVVFLDIDNASYILKLITYLNKHLLGINMDDFVRYSDEYGIHIYGKEKIEITDEYINVNVLEDYMPELISTVIAKSVALERTEEQLVPIIDSIENVIEKLEDGKLGISSRKHARIAAKLVKHEYNIISYIMILDKPDIAWVKSEAGELYDQMAEFFELNDRYEILKKKTESIKSIIDNFSSISNTMRGLFVEWVIVALIMFEIMITIFEKIM
jgi:uncharacterized Rmd1/YagE family protein